MITKEFKNVEFKTALEMLDRQEVEELLTEAISHQMPFGVERLRVVDGRKEVSIRYIGGRRKRILLNGAQ